MGLHHRHPGRRLARGPDRGQGLRRRATAAGHRPDAHVDELWRDPDGRRRGGHLTAWNGPDRLVGGAGADHFVFDKLPWNAGHVADFQLGQDVLDLRPLFAAAGYQGTDPLADGYLTFESDGNGGTRVLFDPDGPGAANPWPFQITTLDGVAPSSLSGSDWLAH
ncbi:type I secretion C-terminal target domain-containing protein [Phenylobacterium sp. J367]|uniref:type I secretion C-terminal target domain-containing protein n=1 Tax=Phenylobacterium sp. J367 TaxID=2898435 RepID=UPI002150A056|nr:type I secretion C-terminal target domain-containing protein [Phenylobacterium sp. J367]MCR5880718.1 type I secretion C-terminal target domain-containing protein [Phenylobacterium sp. J367]